MSEKEDFNMDDIDEVDLKNMNTKNITSIINGGDEPDPDAEPEAATNDGENALVGVMDMMIQSSGDMLKRFDLPAPNLTIWSEWAKPNLNRALNYYFPASAIEVEAPAIALCIGIGGLALAFAPPILVLVKRKLEENEQKRKEEEAKQRAAATAQPAEYVYTTTEKQPEYAMTTTQPESEPEPDNTPVSEEAQQAINRLNEIGQTV